MNKSDKQAKLSRTDATYLTIEIIIWTLIALLAEYIRQQVLFHWIKEFSFNSILTMIGVAIIPILYKLTTQRLPIEDIRLKKQETEEEDQWENFERDEVSYYETLVGQLEDNYWMAKKNAETIYSRSNTFLFSGTLLAIIGIAFFYWHSDTYPLVTGAGLTNLIELSLQRFGGLFFIEGIAFFFLKQYSNSMEEYRYYESIKRQRENQFTIFLAIKEKGVDYAKNLSTIAAFSEDPNKLKKEETTQLIEAKKVIGPDTDVLQKFIDLVQVTRKS